MRPVILSRPSKIAIGWLILSASAASGAPKAAAAVSAAPATFAPVRRGERRDCRCASPVEEIHVGALLVNGGGMKAARLRGRGSRPRNRPRSAGGARRAASSRRAGSPRACRSDSACAAAPTGGACNFLGRRHVDRVMEPAVPARRRFEASETPL